MPPTREARGADGLADRALRTLAFRGPLTGSQLQEALGAPNFALWKACMLDDRIAHRVIGRRYVRLDIKLDGYVRLSPSILREFLTYTVVGPAEDTVALDTAASALADHIQHVSKRKLYTARRIMDEIARPFLTDPVLSRYFCIALAGDIVYEMSHEVLRPERSTGILVQGSDLDIVVLVADDAPEGLAADLDAAIYAKKYYYLRHPAFREELDYVVKSVATLRQQATFGDFHQMVASKVWLEGRYLCGDRALFDRAKDMLAEAGVVDRLAALEDEAIATREYQQQRLLETPWDELHDDDLGLFYTAEESEEFR
ncbi:hypothetical protein GA0111570_10723 [Raineyella antarctica]|uniref:Uncharacterized protein n=1 Tax=Raineyella antarctica TaxID=1577474 RepID=A0A1G6H6R3_9ACTN|nr:hypothetical protein [Raineyella antarctica]SDB89798.1 hypothetical protein GA0111570_10723 [Raineyella antarctica]